MRNGNYLDGGSSGGPKLLRYWREEQTDVTIPEQIIRERSQRTYNTPKRFLTQGPSGARAYLPSSSRFLRTHAIMKVSSFKPFTEIIPEIKLPSYTVKTTIRYTLSLPENILPPEGWTLEKFLGGSGGKGRFPI